MAAIGVPVLYIFFNWEFTPWALIGLAAYGWHTFDSNFVNKTEVRREEVPHLGPQQPFLPSEKTWGISADGTPIPPRYQPPQGQIRR